MAFLVLCGDEVVGVVVVRDAGSGVAQVVLDYVTPKYRDFAPGEFVFRRSGVFTAGRFTKIVTPPAMVTPRPPRFRARRAVVRAGPWSAAIVGTSRSASPM